MVQFMDAACFTSFAPLRGAIDEMFFFPNWDTVFDSIYDKAAGAITIFTMRGCHSNGNGWILKLACNPNGESLPHNAPPSVGRLLLRFRRFV